MTLVVETGTGSSTANTYVDSTDLADYADLRGIVLTAVDLEPLLIRAMDYLESLIFIGDKLTGTQALQWPRENASIDGFDIAEDEIPLLLKESQMEIAIAIDAGYNPLAVQERATKREKVFGAVEIEYMDNSAPQNYVVAISKKVQKLIRGSSSGIYFKAIRA